jgi:hypothetical protein
MRVGLSGWPRTSPAITSARPCSRPAAAPVDRFSSLTMASLRPIRSQYSSECLTSESDLTGQAVIEERAIKRYQSQTFNLTLR